MTPTHFRLLLAAVCIATTLVVAWATQRAIADSRAVLHYARLAGVSVGYEPDGYQIRVTSPGAAADSIVTVSRENGDDPGLDYPVTLYLDKTGRLPPRLGNPDLGGALPPEVTAGFTDRYLKPLGLALGAAALLAVAFYILKTGRLPNGWIWQSPAPWAAAPGAVGVRRLPRHWHACLFWAALGALPLVLLLIERAFGTPPPAAWIGVAGGVVWVTFLCVYAVHLASYQAWATESSVRQSSALGWQEIHWTKVAAIEDRSVKTVHWDSRSRDYSSVSSNTADRTRYYVRLLDYQGRALVDLDRDLAGQAELVRLCAERTGRPIVKRNLTIVDLSGWGPSHSTPRDGE